MKRRQGMSLVEVVIAMILLAVALMAIASSFISSTRLMAHTVDKEKAVLLANRTLDFIEAQDYADLSFTALSSDIDLLTPFDTSWTVTDNGNSKTINLTISWNGVGPNSRVLMEREVSPFAHVVVED